DDEEHPNAHLVEKNPAELEGAKLLRCQAPPVGHAMQQAAREEAQPSPEDEEAVVDDGAPEKHPAHLLDGHSRSPATLATIATCAPCRTPRHERFREPTRRGVGGQCSARFPHYGV